MMAFWQGVNLFGSSKNFSFFGLCFDYTFLLEMAHFFVNFVIILCQPVVTVTVSSVF
jgi:hypothetical protein